MSNTTTRQESIDAAFANGLHVEFSGEQRLVVDCDSPADFEFCKAQLRLLKENRFSFFHATYTVSRSGNYHVYVYLLKPLPLVIRLLLQACLGSDRKHELLNYFQRKEDSNDRVCFLFEKKDTVETLLDLGEIKPVVETETKTTSNNGNLELSGDEKLDDEFIAELEKLEGDTE